MFDIIADHYVAESPATPIDVGLIDTRTTAQNTACVWSDANPANDTGTITSVEADLAALGGSVAFFTISPGNVIRDITATVTAVNGVSTYPVTLAVQTGDYIGVWRTGNASPAVHVTTGPSTFVNTTTTKPSPGNTLARNATQAGRHANIVGTGTT